MILALVYHRCPLLCNQVLDRPDAEPQAAVARRRGRLRRGGRQHRPGGHARAGRPEEGGLPGTLRSARERSGLALPDRRRRSRSTRCREAVGFQYVYDPQTKLFAHAAGVVVLTPGGQARPATSTASNTRPRTWRGELRRAAAGRIGSRDRAGCFCSATTTTRRPASTRSRSSACSASSGPRRPSPWGSNVAL